MIEHEIDLLHGKVKYIVKKNARCKHIRMRIDKDLLVVTVPVKCSMMQVDKFLRLHSEQLSKALEKHKKEMDNFFLTVPEKIEPGVLVPFLGEMVEVQVGKINWDRASNKITLPFIKDAFRELNEFYINELIKVIGELSKEYESKLSVKVKQYRIKSQRQRWGSCSSSGNINFNWRIILLPYDVLEMIFAHELCHLVQMNHSKDFYNLLHQIYPETRSAERWLSEHGRGILALFS